MSDQANCEMITLGRESRGLTQVALAQQVGITQSNISRYESGLVTVPEEALLRLSKALRYPLTFFHQRDERRPTDLFYRRRKGLPSNQLRQIEAKMNIVRMHMGRLLRNVDISTSNRFDSDTVNAAELAPAELASAVRYTWGVPMGPVKDLVSLMESVGAVVVPFAFRTPKIDATSLPGDHCPIFFVNMQVPGDRLRFTLAHEIGHVYMHRIPGPNDEDEANRFASAFLLPEAALRTDVSARLTLRRLADLKVKWKVSMQALVMRARDMRAISHRDCRRLFMRMSQLGYRKREPVGIPAERPTLYRRLLDFHRVELHFSTKEICQLLNLSSERELSEYYYPEKLVFRLTVPEHDKDAHKE